MADTHPPTHRLSPSTHPRAQPPPRRLRKSKSSRLVFRIWILIHFLFAGEHFWCLGTPPLIRGLGICTPHTFSAPEARIHCKNQGILTSHPPSPEIWISLFCVPNIDPNTCPICGGTIVDSPLSGGHHPRHPAHHPPPLSGKGLSGRTFHAVVCTLGLESARCAA